MDLQKLPLEINQLPEVNVFVEIAKDSAIKYELNEQTGFLHADRFLHTAMRFPFNYGFIPNSIGEDNDPLDVLLLASEAVVPGCVVSAKVIGMLEMKDEAGIDTKLIAVPIAKIDPVFGRYQDITDVPEITRQKIKHFFDHYKELEPGKWVKTQGFQNQAKALALIKKLSR